MNDLEEKKIFSTATLDDDFSDDKVIVVLTKKATGQFKDYRPNSFSEIESGVLKINDSLTVTNYHDEDKKINFKVVNLFGFDGLKRVPLEQGSAGDIVCIAGSADVVIGDTLSDKNHVETIPFVKISEPSVEMMFSVNNSPFAGKEGKFCTSRHLKDRLQKEAIKDLSLRVFETESADNFKVLGRG